jgi:hypothetical protein
MPVNYMEFFEQLEKEYELRQMEEEAMNGSDEWTNSSTSS